MKIALVGYGRMGRTLEALATARGHEIAAVVTGRDNAAFEAAGSAEVALDFTRADAVADNVARLAAMGVSVVVGTTGWSDDVEDVAATVRASGIGLLWAPNFSLGVHVFRRIVADAARYMNALADYDVAVHEVHHRHKRDRPSGTARSLADTVVRELQRKRSWSAAPHEPDTEEVLRVTSGRVGEVPGTHVVRFDGPFDAVTLEHAARGREAFAHGAITAAEWLRGRAGMFDLDDMLVDAAAMAAAEEEQRTRGDDR